MNRKSNPVQLYKKFKKWVKPPIGSSTRTMLLNWFKNQLTFVCVWKLLKKNYFFTFYFNFLTNNPAFIFFFNTFNTKITKKKFLLIL